MGALRTVVVTGGARGIGAATCRAFAALGDAIIVLDADGQAAGALAEEIVDGGGTAWPLACDTGDRRQVADAFAAVDALAGPPSVLVNNAGFNHHMAPTEVEMDIWDRMLAVNLTGYFLCSREAADRMLAVGAGAIVNVSSIAGSSALGRGNVAYSVTKGGVEAMTRELAVAWAPRGIRVNAVAPCQVATEGFVTSTDALLQAGDRTAADHLHGIPMGRLAAPAEIASAIVFLASAAASMVTGVVLPVDGGNLALNAGGSVG